MNRKELIDQIRSKKSFLCVGLDPDSQKMPLHIPRSHEGYSFFLRTIIDYTSDYCVAYKPNWAFFESLGPWGLNLLTEIIAYIPNTHLCIADAKRGDIGNTANKYAQAILGDMGADAITVAPYMGKDSIMPFALDDKWVIILALTSNEGSNDFQRITDANGVAFYEHILLQCSNWLNPDQSMFVVGATHPEDFKRIRQLVPNHFLLVPGVGAQGGSLDDVCKYGLTQDIGLLVNSSRGILYAGSDEDFGRASQEQAKIIQLTMSHYL